jgi:hypothetical protein
LEKNGLKLDYLYLGLVNNKMTTSFTNQLLFDLFFFILIK